VADYFARGRQLIRAVLERSGYAVSEASDGNQAVRRARKKMPDLIVLDLCVPGLDGFEVLRELRRDEKLTATPILAMTACSMPGDRERALAAGFNGYFAKPFSLSGLVGEMELLLAERTSDRECRQLRSFAAHS
jgi:CheY-like chemotaxis protein